MTSDTRGRRGRCVGHADCWGALPGPSPFGVSWQPQQHFSFQEADITPCTVQYINLNPASAYFSLISHVLSGYPQGYHLVSLGISSRYTLISSLDTGHTTSCVLLDARWGGSAIWHPPQSSIHPIPASTPFPTGTSTSRLPLQLRGRPIASTDAAACCRKAPENNTNTGGAIQNETLCKVMDHAGCPAGPMSPFRAGHSPGCGGTGLGFAKPL